MAGGDLSYLRRKPITCNYVYWRISNSLFYLPVSREVSALVSICCSSCVLYPTRNTMSHPNTEEVSGKETVLPVLEGTGSVAHSSGLSSLWCQRGGHADPHRALTGPQAPWPPGNFISDIDEQRWLIVFLAVFFLILRGGKGILDSNDSNSFHLSSATQLLHLCGVLHTHPPRWRRTRICPISQILCTLPQKFCRTWTVQGCRLSHLLAGQGHPFPLVLWSLLPGTFPWSPPGWSQCSHDTGVSASRHFRFLWHLSGHIHTEDSKWWNSCLEVSWSICFLIINFKPNAWSTAVEWMNEWMLA